MKITTRTEDRLTIENTPWLLALVIVAFGLVIIGFGLNETLSGAAAMGIALMLIGALSMAAALLAFVRRSQIILDRPAASVTLRRKSFTSTTEEARPLEFLLRAETEIGGSDSTRNPTRRVVLIFADSPPMPLTKVFSRGPSHDLTAKRINRWLDSWRGEGTSAGTVDLDLPLD